MITIKDVAAATGLSVTTISVVLSGKADGRRIARGTRERVVEAATRLGFQHNGHARSLRSGRSNLIGIVGVSFNHPIPVMGVRCAAQALLKHGYNIVLHDLSWQPGGEEHGFRDLESRRVEGLLMVTSRATRAQGALARIAARGVPIVMMDDWDVPYGDVVTVDREEGAYLATRHLLLQGHQRIVLTVPEGATAPSLRARVRGYRRAHQEAGVGVDERLLMEPAPGQPSYEHGLEIVPRVLAHPARPTALFCVNDMMAVGALQALYAAGKRVPTDLAVVGFDGIEEAAFAVVPLTTVVQPIPEAAETAVSLLLERLNGGNEAQLSRRVVIAPRLVIRQSSGVRCGT